MNKRLLYPIIIISTFIIGILLNGLLTGIYNFKYPSGNELEFIKLEVTRNFVMFLSTCVFYVIIILRFENYKLLRLFSGSSLLITFSFAAYVSLNRYYHFDTKIVEIYSYTTYFLGLFNIYLATSIILKELHHKRVAITIMYSSLITFFFGTLVVEQIRGYISGFFGIEYNTIDTVFIVYNIILFLLRFSVVIAQAFAIVKLLEYKNHGKVIYVRKTLEERY